MRFCIQYQYTGDDAGPARNAVVEADAIEQAVEAFSRTAVPRNLSWPLYAVPLDEDLGGYYVVEPSLDGPVVVESDPDGHPY
jgi:hypothetical protein